MGRKSEYEGMRIYPRGRKSPPGVATGSVRRCQLEGCPGLRVMVRWPGGKVTWPCTKGMDRGPHRKSMVIH